MNRRYPQLEIDLSALRSNAQHIVRRCHDRHIRVCGVVKGADGHAPCANAAQMNWVPAVWNRWKSAAPPVSAGHGC